jgi:type IV secretory pathway TrbL component
MDFLTWRKKPNIHLANYLQYYSLESADVEAADSNKGGVGKIELNKSALSGPSQSQRSSDVSKQLASNQRCRSTAGPDDCYQT